MPLSETVGIASGIASGVAAVFLIGIKSAQYVLRSFHDAHVVPSLAHVTAAISTNTAATSALTSSLATTNEAQERGFIRMGEIITEHETRLATHDAEIESLGRVTFAAPAVIRPKRRGG